MTKEQIRQQLPHYAKELIRRAVATKLKIRRDYLIRSDDAQAAVDRCVANVKAIADHETLDGAIDEIFAARSRQEPNISRRDIQQAIEACYNTFGTEIAGIERMHQINHMNFDPKDMWDFLRCRVPIAPEYDDERIRVADAWLLRGEIVHLPLGSAELIPLRTVSADEP
jgi:hypothetical protein